MSRFLLCQGIVVPCMEDNAKRGYAARWSSVFAVLLEIHSYNGIALFGCLTYSGEAVALMECNLSFGILETDDFVARQRMAAGTTLILHLWAIGEEAAQTALCFIGKHMVLPVCFWYCILCSTYLYTIAPMEHRLHRGQLTVDTCIHGMKSNFGMNFEGKIECCGIFGSTIHLPLGVKAMMLSW